MNKVNDVGDAMFWWLEEIPLSELPDEAQTTVKGYRSGKYNVTQATNRLKSQCEGLIAEWININNELNSL